MSTMNIFLLHFVLILLVLTTVNCAVDFGACCIRRGDISCIETTSSECSLLDGTFSPSKTCSLVYCCVDSAFDFSTMALAYSSINNNPTTNIIHGTVVVGDGNSNGLVADRIISNSALSIEYIQKARYLYSSLDALVCNIQLSTPVDTMITLTSGVYCFTQQASIRNTVVFNGKGIFIIKVMYNFEAINANYQLLNGASAGDIFWVIGQSVNTDTSRLIGTIISQGPINANNLNINGRVMSVGGNLAFNNVVITSSSVSKCHAPVEPVRPVLQCYRYINNGTKCETKWGYTNDNPYAIYLMEQFSIETCDNDHIYLQLFETGETHDVITCEHPCDRNVRMTIGDLYDDWVGL